MLYNIIDLETTGLSSSVNDIVQFAFITIDHNFRIIRAKNCYMYQEGMDWTAKAESIHHLSREFLKQYEDEFDYNLCILNTVTHRCNLVGHNITGFDLPFIKGFLLKNGILAPTEGMVYDTMKIYQNVYHKRIKLVKLTEMLGITEDTILRYVSLLFKDKAGAHNAMYDTVATMLCLRKAIEQGLCTLAQGNEVAYELTI